MRQFVHYTFLTILCLIGITCSAQSYQSYTCTLGTQDNDVIVIGYCVEYQNGSFIVNFNSLNIEQRYNRDGKELHVVFFSKIGKYDDNVVFQGTNYEQISTPSTANVKRCGHGYMDLKDANPQVTFTASEDCEVKIPIYLVEREKKWRIRGKSNITFNYLSHTTEPLVVKLIRPKGSHSHPQSKQPPKPSTATGNPLDDEIWVDDPGDLGVIIEPGNNDNVLDNIARELSDTVSSNPYGPGASSKPLNPDALRDLKQDIEKSESLDDLELLSNQIENLRERQLTSSESASEIKRVIDAYDNKVKMFKAKEKEKQKLKELLFLCLAILAIVLGFVIKPAYNEYRRRKEKKEQDDMMRRAEKEAEEARRRAERKAKKMLDPESGKNSKIFKI